MKIKMIMFVILGVIGAASVSFAQALEPGSHTGESSSTGVTSVSSDSPFSSSVGYDSGDHGNVS